MMPFTEYLFSEDAIKASVEELKENLKENTGRSNLKGYALGVIKRRLVREPLRYRDYGPYWWAVKRLLQDDDYYLGGDDDEELRATYCGATPEETIVMADTFRKFNLANFVLGTNQFVLDGELGDPWTLWDDDMENAAIQAAQLL